MTLQYLRIFSPTVYATFVPSAGCIKIVMRGPAGGGGCS